VQLKTGTARIALTVANRGNVSASIVPCGLNYINRHRFRSQALLNFGKPIVIDDAQRDHFRRDEQEAVVALTERIAKEIRGLTINAPDWRTVRAMQIVRRLYKPGSAKLTTAQYVELTRRFVDGYLQQRDDPEMQALMADVEDYQARLDLLGLKDYQLRQPVNIAKAIRKLTARGLAMFLLLPLAIPGALLHLPIGWIAATVGDKLSYEKDDVATLKVFAAILLLPVLYIAVAVFIGMQFGAWWGLGLLLALPFSFFASVRLIEAEVGLILSILSLLRLGRFRNDIEELRKTRTKLVGRIRTRVERSVDPEMQRIFTEEDFAIGKSDLAG
jgi:glycerol-3-phosphate O-acyltransferase/dihydroxyacetone phosphate acyltransferase